MNNENALDNFFQLIHAVKKKIQSEVERLELPIAFMHLKAIKVISKMPDCTAIDIAHFLGRDKAQITRLINDLLKEGYIEKRPNARDKRSQYLVLTQKSQSVLKKVQEMDKKIFMQMQQDLTEKDLADFYRISSQITKNLTL